MRKLWGIFLSVAVLATGCGRRAEEFKGPPVQSQFGVFVPDTAIDIKGGLKPIKPLPINSSTVTVSSARWLSLAEVLLENQSHRQMVELGHSLLSQFYNIPQSHTNMTGTTSPPGSPYAETALFYAKPLMANKLDASITQAQLDVATVAGTVSVSLSDLPRYPEPDAIIERLVGGLRDFKEGLSKKSSDSVITNITKKVDAQFIPDLQGLAEASKINPKSLISSLTTLKNRLANLTEISDFDRRHLLNQVQLALDLASKSEVMNNSDDALAFLADLWTGKDIRKNFPGPLREFFKDLNERQILALATQNDVTIVPQDQWPAIRDEKDTLILSDRALVAQYLQNNGNLLSDQDWGKLQGKRGQLDQLLNRKDISYFARLVSNVTSDDPAEQRFALVSSWLAVSERISVPDDLKRVFSTLTDEEVYLIGHNNSLLLGVQAHIQLMGLRYGIIDALDKKGPSYVKSMFAAIIQACVKERVDLALIPIAANFPVRLRDAIVPQLEQSRSEINQSVETTYKDYGRYYLGKLIFGVDNLQKGSGRPESDNLVLQKNPLPILEKDSISFTNQNGKWAASSALNETSPETLGLALNAFAHRLRNLKEFENISEDSREASAIEYSAISKLLALAGYRDYDNNLTQSLMVRMAQDNPMSLFDIRNYDPAQGVFAVPDKILIKDNFKLDPASRAHPAVGVVGQMELLRGYAQMMKLLKPWNPSVYDSGLGAARIDEVPDVVPFDRGDYFLLSVGLGAYVLKNIPYKMLGLISSDKKYIDGTKLDDPSQVSAIGAVLSDYTRDQISSQVRTEDLAKSIISMSEFFDQIKDLEKSKNPAIVTEIQGDALRVAQGKLQRLISGVVLFTTNFLLQEDGGFSSGFDLKAMKVTTAERQLTDQVLMEEALLVAGRVLDSGFMVARAFDNFFFLNSTFWNPDLGYYRSSERDQSGRVQLINVARSLHNIRRFFESSSVTQGSKSDSFDQMRELEALWTARFFGADTRNLAPVYLISEFSL